MANHRSTCQYNPILLASQSSSMTGVWWYEVQCAFVGGDSCRSIGEFNVSWRICSMWFQLSLETSTPSTIFGVRFRQVLSFHWLARKYFAFRNNVSLSRTAVKCDLLWTYCRLAPGENLFCERRNLKMRFSSTKFIWIPFGSLVYLNFRIFVSVTWIHGAIVYVDAWWGFSRRQSLRWDQSLCFHWFYAPPIGRDGCMILLTRIVYFLSSPLAIK